VQGRVNAAEGTDVCTAVLISLPDYMINTYMPQKLLYLTGKSSKSDFLKCEQQLYTLMNNADGIPLLYFQCK